jgi:hypothetical protein
LPCGLVTLEHEFLTLVYGLMGLVMSEIHGYIHLTLNPSQHLERKGNGMFMGLVVLLPMATPDREKGKEGFMGLL